MHKQNDVRDQNLDLFPESIDRKHLASLFSKKLGYKAPMLPVDWRCFACGIDLLDHFQNTGVAKASGCPKCNRSFCS